MNELPFRFTETIGNKPSALDLVKDIKDSSTCVGELDKPIYFEAKSRTELTPLTKETSESLRERGAGDKTIESIGSEEEAQIYIDSGLECKEINEKEALTRTDIDYDQKDSFGKTNLERMEKGKAPLGQNGKPIELHHVGQKMDSPLAELTKSEHMSNGNDTVLHNKQKESEINRTEFKDERAEHWKTRAEAHKATLNA